MKEVWGMIISEGSKLVTTFIRTRPLKRSRPVEAVPSASITEAIPELFVGAEESPPILEAPKRERKAGAKIGKVSPSKTSGVQSEADYRFECLTKHLSTASTTIKEGIDRAVDEGADSDGVQEKVRETMKEINGMGADLDIMLSTEASEAAEFFVSGTRNFRKAVWESRLETGGGTMEDLQAAKSWVDILLAKAYDAAKEHPGTECIRQA